jgi:hypothetical protein
MYRRAVTIAKLRGSHTMAEQPEGSSRKQVITIFGDEGQRSLELTVTRELLELFDLTAVINRGTSERFHYSFSGLIIAFRYAEHGMSRWFRQYLSQQSVDFAAILTYRGILEDQLHDQIASYELPFRDPNTVYPNGRRSATASALEWIGFAKSLAQEQEHAWTGLRHLMGAIIFAPNFHAEDLNRWRFERREWASSYLDYVKSELPKDLDFWRQVNARTFTPTSTELSQADIDRFSRDVRTILARANEARENEKKDRIYTEHLVFGLREPGSQLTRLAEASGVDLDMVLKRDYGISKDQPFELHSMPPLSQNAYGALVVARDKANSNGSKVIEATHLLFGVLSQATSTIVQELNRRGITSDKVVVGTEVVPNAVQTSTAESTLARFDLGKYRLSIGATTVLRSASSSAAQNDAPVSTSFVLLEIAGKGRLGRERQWAADFLLDAVFGSAGKFQEVMIEFRDAKQRSSPVDQKSSSRPEASMMKPGLAWLLKRAEEIATETTGNATICARHLVAGLIVDAPRPYTLGAQRLLTKMGVDIPLLRQRMYEWVRGYGDDDTRWRSVLIGTGTEPRRKVEFAADTTTGLDFIGIEQDVLALATLIAARDSLPPLSIGLFGDWGSGKTFFMGQLRSAVAQFSKEAREANMMQRDLPFYKHIVQIDFNAWHYVEGNLWASMVEHILENLRVSDDQRLTITEEMQKRWIDQLGFTERAREEADKKNAQAAARVSQAETAVRTAVNKHEAKKTELQTLSRKNVVRDFELSGALQVITDLLEPLGLKPLSGAVADLKTSLQQAKSAVEGGNAVLSPLIYAKDKKNRWRSLLIILLGAPFAAVAIGWILNRLGHEQMAQISAWATGAAGLLTAGATWLRKQAEWVSEQSKKVETAQRTYDEALAKELASTADQIAKTEQELALARQDYMLAQQRVEQARSAQEAARSELAAATTARLLGQFIQDRAASTDYRKHLGVLALVRQDFQKLSSLIEEDNWRLAPPGPNDQRFIERGLRKITSLEEENTDAATRINRIVLYIDDLDRCPPAKVVEVLQAVHLLLAFPLFVVVVGVDARWISRSLESRYRELLHFGQSDSSVDITEMFGVARSEDYLEKIFQIPLWLRRMDGGTAQRMVQGLLGKRIQPTNKNSEPDMIPHDTKPAPPPSGQNVAPPNQTAGEGQQPSVSTPAALGANVQYTGGTPTAPPPKSTSPAATKVIIPNLQSLEIRDFEISAIDGLAPLLGRSPRALKRFVNLYRLIKAGLTPTEHNAFIRQSENSLGGFQAVLFLLAIDTGLPRVSRLAFDALLEMKETGDFAVKQLLEKVDKHPSAKTADWNTLKEWLGALNGFERFERGMPVVAEWVPQVARYSFQASHIEGGRESRELLSKNQDQ